jgi:predicted amidohydrolase
MDAIKIATAQFENRSGDKQYNLSVIDELSRQAAAGGAQVIAFHECSVTGYTFARHLSEQQMLEVAELIPEGESISRLVAIAKKNNIVILAGLFEKDMEDKLFKAYVCVDKNGLIAKYRKLHPFINPHLTPGNQYCVFDLYGWKCGIFMPHVTMCTPSSRPGAGFVDPKLWENRVNDPTSLRIEFDGMKGRDWLMKWLPARAYDNAVYAIFSNPIGMDDDQLKNGCSMIIDPFGDVIAECRMLGDDFITATLTRDKLTAAGGYRYLKARRPDLYRDIVGQAHTPEQKVIWMLNQKK